MIVIAILILFLAAATTAVEGTAPLLREDVLLSGPLLSAHFSAQLELGLDSASLVS